LSVTEIIGTLDAACGFSRVFQGKRALTLSVTEL
jgi:hypothetical protein